MYGHKSKTGARVLPSPSAVPSPIADKKIDLPVSIKDPSVSDLYLAYNFFGPIKEIKDTTAGKQIILDTTEKDLPNFIISGQETSIGRISPNNAPTPASEKDLKTGQHVAISATYNVKKGDWVTRNVNIVD